MNRVIPFKLITFDVMGTLLNFKFPPAKKYWEVARLNGLNIDQARLNDNFKEQFTEMSRCYPNYGRYCGMGWQKWWQLLVVGVMKSSVSHCSKESSKYEAIATDLINFYKTADAYIVCDGAEEILTYLRALHICIGIISNADERLHCIIDSVQLSSYFNFVVPSYEAQAEKPDRCIFEYAISKTNTHVVTKECLHVGDKYEADYLGAIGAGWRGALIAPDQNKLQELKEKAHPKHVFENLLTLKRNLSNYTME